MKKFSLVCTCIIFFGLGNSAFGKPTTKPARDLAMGDGISEVGSFRCEKLTFLSVGSEWVHFNCFDKTNAVEKKMALQNSNAADDLRYFIQNPKTNLKLQILPCDQFDIISRYNNTGSKTDSKGRLYACGVGVVNE